ncbi:copper amine oxidase N-terminal domain-containing protein [Paenibacillus macerans]|uniref:copper amine oxidase N-terminal domain-containing protein n=1 Tax=Paenibacillus macerans TaxID=44252 RepID=UPI003D321ED9
MKIKTLFISAALLVLVALSSISNVNAAVTPVYGSVVVNGETLNFEAKPIVLNGNTMVPFRQIFEAMGMGVEWNNETKTVTATKADLAIKMTPDNFKASVNDKEYTLTQTPFVTPEGIFYVNLRFISEAAGATVSWDNINKVATIDTEA